MIYFDIETKANEKALKFLEEPMKNTYALLLTENKQMLLPTIRSRAVVLSFKSLPHEE
ncbi:MAG: DNA polymerase III subunit delta', partial [Actinomycetaceae bacterium]|nr:DNA polymerase III subunit delta' [Actinomycetaceae bacterium]